MKTIKVPSFRAWKNVQPGINRKPTLHITGIVYATLCQTPYLKPLKGSAGLMFEVAFKTITGKICPDIELPRELTPYTQQIVGSETEVLINVGDAKPIKVPIETVSFK
jgi:hypothetical protein